MLVQKLLLIIYILKTEIVKEEDKNSYYNENTNSDESLNINHLGYIEQYKY